MDSALCTGSPALKEKSMGFDIDFGFVSVAVLTTAVAV
jgi:hypothetical protein